MGINFTKIFAHLFGKKQFKAVILGLDSAGKTTILYWLKNQKVEVSVPTIGMNVQSVQFQNVTFTVWDIGGQAKIRQLWNHYYQNAQALIYVVDSSDKERIQIARQELFNMLSSDKLQNVPLLVVANKQDLGVMNVSKVTEKLGLLNIKGRQWHIQGTCALKGEGLLKGISWLFKTAAQKK